LAQNVRDRVMAAFREGKIRYLVATDVVGRGIDVSGISHIINYDIPQFCDDYVHRVGRTGRMGREGVAYTFVSPEEGNELTRIEMRIDRLLTRDEIPDFVAVVERPRDGAAMINRSDNGGDSARSEPESTAETAETLVAKPRRSPPLLGRGGRAPRRIRRAL
jgi:ATP-dependent RNA helicase DeaD